MITYLNLILPTICLSTDKDLSRTSLKKKKKKLGQPLIGLIKKIKLKSIIGGYFKIKSDYW